ncbi:MAG: AraC family transcriptional regulator [Victivallales bacterium]
MKSKSTLPSENLFVDILPDSLWGGPNPERSLSASPVFISRFKGPRTNPAMLSHDFWEFSCLLNGRMALQHPKGNHVLREGSVCLIPPKMGHREESPENPESIWIGFTGSALDKAPFKEVTFTHSEALAEEAKKIWLTAQRGHSRIGIELDGLLLSFIGRYIRCENDQEDKGELDIISKAILMINDRFGEEISMSDIARELKLSLGYFHRAFRKRTGQSPHDYLRQMRISRASNLLLQSSLPLSRISEMCGYRDPLYFSRAFKKTKGVSPSEFRLSATIPA